MRTEDIVNRVFTRSFMGYDIEEVDRFLDEVIDALEQYEADKKEMMTAMEFLMQKIENGERPPAAEMRKAIDSGKPAKKNGLLPERTQDVRIPPKRTDRGTAAQRKEKQDGAKAKTARAITPGGSGTPKPVRAPKVKRVAAQQPETANEQPAQKREDWLDELLDNLSDRDKQGYTEPARQAAWKESAAETAAAQPQEQSADDTTERQQRAQPAPETTRANVPPAPIKTILQTQTVPETMNAQPAPEQPNAQPAPETIKAQPAPQPAGETRRELAEQGPKQERPSTEDAIRSFEETLRSLGGQPRTEKQPTDNKTAEEIPEHKPKHAAASEDKPS